MKFLKGFTCVLLMLSYIALGGLLYSYFGTDYLGLMYKINFMEALVLVLAASNILHILHMRFTKCYYKRLTKEGKFDQYIDEPMRKHCCGR